MGADQSKPTGSPSSAPSSTSAGPEDFYTLLEVDDGAGELEIKVRPPVAPLLDSRPASRQRQAVEQPIADWLTSSASLSTCCLRPGR
jgi:hypothetical protein